MRNIRNLTENWKQPLFDDGEKNHSLPLEMPFAEAPETLTLTRDFKLPADEKASAFYLEIRALSGRCKIEIDGAEVREFRSVFAPRVTDVTSFIKKGEAQTLTLTITPEARPDGLFLLGGVSLIGAGLSHFAISDEVSPLTIHTVFTDAGVTVRMHTEIENPNNYDVLLFRLTSPEGILIDVKSARPTDANTAFDLPAPMLWEGLHAAYQYKAEVLLQRDSEMIDMTQCAFGIRDFRAEPGGFFTLNGIKLPLNGAFLRGSGTAADIGCLTALDANLAGITSFSPDEDLLDRCDSLGILVFFKFPETGDDADFEELAPLTRMLARHPSAAFMAYESRDPAYGKKFCATVKNNAQYMYTVGGCDILEADALSDAIPDVLLLNYTVSSEKNGFTELHSRFASVLEAHPNYRFAVFPKAPECFTDRHSVGATRPDCSQEYFSMWHARVWEIFSTHKNTACYFTGYLSDESPKKDRSGLVTADRAEQKDAFWFYKSRFSAAPYCKLASLPASVTGKTVDVKCYTNALKLKLLVNGKEKKRRLPVRLSENVYVFEKIKLKRKKNVIALSCENGEDTAEVFRSKSRLAKK